MPTRGPQACALAAVGLVALLHLASCRSAPSTRGYGNDRGDDAAAPVAVVEGRPISKGVLADYWFDRYPEEYGRTLNALIDERIVLARAQRDRLIVPPRALERAVTAEIDARRKQIATTYGEEARLEVQVQRAYGVDVPTWTERILRPRLHVKLLMDRVIRWDTRSRPRVHARVIVLHDAVRAAKVAAKVRRGADFSLTAHKESKDASARVGGDLPPFGRGDLAYPGVEERLFRAPQGGVVGPLEVRVDDRPQYQIYKIIEHTQAWQGERAARVERLENDLAANRVTRAEYERWRARVRRDTGVRYYQPDGRIWSPPAGR